MNSATPWRLLEWDSQFFGKRIATLGETRLDRDRMRRALDWCRANMIDCAYLLSQADDPATTRLAEDNAFRLVDLRVTLELSTSSAAGPTTAPSTLAVRRCRAADVPSLRALAMVSHTSSRFYNDPRFDRQRCGELYATWIEKSCDGWADVVFVAEHEGRAQGYCTCARRDGGRGEIGLVGIAPQLRGRGLGQALIEHALRWFRAEGLTRVSVITQGNNVSAQRFYQNAGFRTSDVQLWHHRWFDADGAKAR